MTLTTPSVAVLFARSDSIYKRDPRCDVFDATRDARTYTGNLPVIAHPPCRAWGRLRAFANPRPDEMDLARWAVSVVRRVGGVLEHPAASLLWPDQNLPKPGRCDQFGGWTLGIRQSEYGHKADKPTYLYIVGIRPGEEPPKPLRLEYPTHVIQSRKRAGYLPHVSKAEREHTPPDLARWLVDLALLCALNLDDRLGKSPDVDLDQTPAASPTYTVSTRPDGPGD